jgi:RNA polymerase sporulation-specific sigma factor
MTEQQQALCLGSMRLVSHCAKKFLPSGIPWEELCASGNLGLAQAAATFSAGKNTCFSTYACRCIENEICKLLRQRKKHGKVESLDGELAGTDGMSFYDVLPDDADMAEAVELKLLTSDALVRIGRLPAKRRSVWEMRFGLAGEPPMKQKEIAKRMGCSRALISKILKDDIKRIKGEVL